jgi:rhodanese-related sulfurtransferase
VAGRQRRPLVKNILREGCVVAIVGIVLAYGANSVSPRGLKLTRDYFPSDRVQTNSTPAVATNTPVRVAVTNAVALAATNSVEQLKKELLDKGMSLADSNQVAQLFRDPKYPTGLIAFIDARNDKEYEAGHIPGAYLLDHYRPDKYLPTVLPACNVAEKIIVYCSGGDCIDSKETAFTLAQVVPKERLLVYLGGYTEWTGNQLPVEAGERNSGNLRTNAPAQGGAHK